MRRSLKERLYHKLLVWAQARYLDVKDERVSTDLYIGITDHAIIRYLERVEGVNISQIRANLLAIKLGHNTRTFRDGKHHLGRLVAVVKDRVIVTVYLAVSR